MAAAYLFHPVQNFSMETSASAQQLSLRLVMNGIETKIPNQTLSQMVLSAAQGAERAAIAEFLRKHAGH
jgi:hypothetical protein